MLLFSVTIGTTTGILYGDFWEHSAVVQAIITDPSAPKHPFFVLDAAHAFLSPYTLIVSQVAQIVNTSSIEALLLIGVLNFLLLLFGLRYFCPVATKEDSWLSASYAIVLILLLWGSNPWGYSGFLHYSQIADVLPYPSTFALGLTLVSLRLYQQGLAGERAWLTLVVYFFYWLVLLTHPLTAIYFTCALAGQILCAPKKQRDLVVLQTSLGLLAALYLATQWPYFSIIDLLRGAGDVYHPENRSMYVDVISRTWPTLMALPLATWAFKDKKGQAILLTILMLFGVYVYGGLTEKYSFGRVISIIMILLQILIAVGVARLELGVTRKLPAFKVIIPLALFSTLIYFSFPWLQSTATRALTVVNSIRLGRPISSQISYKDLLFLKEYINDNSVVFSDLETSWIVPSIRGKVVGALHPQAFVADQKIRFNDVNLFFDANTSTAQRLALTKKYHSDFLLLNKHTIKDYITMQEFFVANNLGVIVYDSDHYVLLKLSLAN